MPALNERTVRVKGLREMQRAFARADKKLSRELRDRLKDAAQPIAATAEQLTAAGRPIRNLSPGQPWSKMRVGVTRKSVYVAPKERGVKSRANFKRRRPNLADRLMDDAMSPALDKHIDKARDAVGRLLDEVGRDWER